MRFRLTKNYRNYSKKRSLNNTIDRLDYVKFGGFKKQVSICTMKRMTMWLVYEKFMFSIDLLQNLCKLYRQTSLVVKLIFWAFVLLGPFLAYSQSNVMECFAWFYGKRKCETMRWRKSNFYNRTKIFLVTKIVKLNFDHSVGRFSTRLLDWTTKIVTFHSFHCFKTAGE